MNKLRSTDDDELHAMADFDTVLDETPKDEKTRGVVLPVSHTFADLAGGSCASLATRPR